MPLTGFPWDPKTFVFSKSTNQSRNKKKPTKNRQSHKKWNDRKELLKYKKKYASVLFCAFTFGGKNLFTFFALSDRLYL